MKKLSALVLSLIGMLIILYSLIFLDGFQAGLISLLGVLFTLSGTVVALLSLGISTHDRWLMNANIIIFAFIVVMTIIKLAIHV